MKQKIAELINIIFGFRKFILMLALYLVSVVFRVKDLITGGEMVTLLSNTTIAFFGANGVEHLMTTVKEYINAKGQPVAVQTPPVAAADDEVVEDDVPDAAEPGATK